MKDNLILIGMPGVGKSNGGTDATPCMNTEATS